MPEEDRPPERMWLDHELLAEHFEQVKQRYKNRGSGGSDDEAVPQAESVENELTRDLVRR